MKGARKDHDWIRFPRTNNERRQNTDGFGRACRAGKHLPNSWDDYRRRSQEDVNWKKFRKTQYKTVDKFETTTFKDSTNYAKRETAKSEARKHIRKWGGCRCGECWSIRRKEIAEYWKEKERQEQKWLDSQAKYSIMDRVKTHDKRSW